ncbi:MAG TPA: signal peptidase II [Gammaproteobacteria bacterium]|nr:signal peptidase II [Gammaproteobacteria bacterium]
MSEQAYPAGRERGALGWLWLSAFVVVADQLSKAYIVATFELYDRVQLLPVFGITRLHNTGAAFSFLASAGGWQRWFFVAIAVAVTALVCVWLKRMPRRGQAWLAASLALVVGGAIGNVIDRLFRGHVVDFISVHYDRWFFPAFNVADSALTVGAAILLIESFYDGRRKKKII